ncbi:MAG: anti-sigma F factor [Firmicutes bacterium]|nr:anti-sigma F factor [Bacillota bacterium]
MAGDRQQAANRLYMEVDSVAANVGLVRVAVAALAAQAGFTISDVEEIKVAVSEAVSNSVLHGYGVPSGGASGVIRVTAILRTGSIAIVVEDDGKGMDDVERCMKGGAGDDPERMGLGFIFMKSLMDSVEVTSTPGRGTRVSMSKYVPGAEGGRG